MLSLLNLGFLDFPANSRQILKIILLQTVKCEAAKVKPFEQFPTELSRQIRYILTDIDDTLTVNGPIHFLTDLTGSG